jgi:hypothetical protein
MLRLLGRRERERYRQIDIELDREIERQRESNCLTVQHRDILRKIKLDLRQTGKEREREKESARELSARELSG